MISTEFQNIALDEIAERTRRRDFSVLRVPGLFSPMELQKALLEVRAKFEFQTKDSERGYSALGLQFSNPEDPLYDAVASVSDVYVGGAASPRVETRRKDACFPEFNEAAKPFKFVFSGLAPIRSFRARLLTTEPGYSMPELHVDGRYGVRLHIPVETNPDAWMQVGREHFHLPADGSAYLLNTSRAHRVGNPGATARTHLVLVLFEPAVWDVGEAMIERISRYFDRIGLDLDLINPMREHLIAQTEGSNCSLCGAKTLSFVPSEFENRPGDPVQNPIDFFQWLCSSCAHEIERELPRELGVPFDSTNPKPRQDWISNSLKSRVSGRS